MTALKKFERFESTALWTASGACQPREVILVVGKSMAVIMDINDVPLAHWSLGAIRKLSAGRCVIYAPSPDADERLEIEDPIMIEALDRIYDRMHAPLPRKLPRWPRFVFAGLVAALLGGGGFLILPGQLARMAEWAAPEAQKKEIGREIAAHLERVVGPGCKGVEVGRILKKLHERIFEQSAGRITILPLGERKTVLLPASVLVLDASLVADFDSPDILAGYALAATISVQNNPPLRDFLTSSGFWTASRLLTRTTISTDDYDIYARKILQSETASAAPNTALLAAFNAAQISSRAYAYARDPSGKSVGALIEKNPMRGQAFEPSLSSFEWHILQNLCAQR